MRDEKQSLRLLRIRAANVLRLCRRPDGRELSDCAVARRVRGLLPSQVAAVREELEACGYLTDELDQGDESQGGKE